MPRKVYRVDKPSSRTEKGCIYDHLMVVLCQTTDERVLLRCWRAMRIINKTGDLFALQPKFDTNASRTRLHQQIHELLAKGVPYTRIATQLGIDWRTAKAQRDYWFKLRRSERDELLDLYDRYRSDVAVEQVRALIADAIIQHDRVRGRESEE